MKRMACLLVVVVSTAWALRSSAVVGIDMSSAMEDIAYQTVRRLNADKRTCSEVRNIAFAKLSVDQGSKTFKDTADIHSVFETALAAAPGGLKFVVHTGNDDEWALIDEVFKQARDMSSWDPKTNPKLKELKLCDALLHGSLVWCEVDGEEGVVLVKANLRLLKVSTGEILWGGVIESRLTRGGPDNERVSLNWRRALESCAADAVAKLPKSLDGYGVLILPIEGQSGTAMEQVFLNALTAAGKQDRIAVYDLPRGNMQDRMFARFLSDRGAQSVRDEEFERRSIGQYVTAKKLPERLVVLSGMVSVVNENPKFELDASGLPVDFLGGAAAVAAQQRKSYEVVCDFKFRDVNDSFRLVGSVGAVGRYAPPMSGPDWVKRFLRRLFSLLDDGNVGRLLKIVLALVVLVVVWRLIRKIVSGSSRPR